MSLGHTGTLQGPAHSPVLASREHGEGCFQDVVSRGKRGPENSPDRTREQGQLVASEAREGASGVEKSLPWPAGQEPSPGCAGLPWTSSESRVTVIVQEPVHGFLQVQHSPQP